jgi:hypothetical protein
MPIGVCIAILRSLNKTNLDEANRDNEFTSLIPSAVEYLSRIRDRAERKTKSSRILGRVEQSESPCRHSHMLHGGITFVT